MGHTESIMVEGPDNVQGRCGSDSPSTGSVNSGKLLSLSVPQFPYLQNGVNDNIDLTEV